MPDGIVQWFDSEAGEGRVLHRRRRYAVDARDIESDARTPGARVHFDIDHTSDDTRAVEVTLRRGIRSAKAQRRFGDTTGAPTDSSKKPISTAHDVFDLDPGLFRSPIKAAEYWSEQMAIGDLDEVMVLYSPTASLHADGRVLFGLDEIRRHWHATPLLGGPAPAAIHGDEDGAVIIRWMLPQSGMVESRLRISRGEVTEHWHGVLETPEAEDEDELPLELSIDGTVSQRHRDRALDRIGKVLSKVDAPVLHARIRLVNTVDSGRDRPAIARVMLDINGDPIRAEVAADDLDGAIDGLEERLRAQLERMASLRDAQRRRGATNPDGGWRHGDLPTERPGHYPRPVEERQVVRHKTFTTVEATLDEAIFDLETLDYDFFLFTDLATGQEAFVTRREDGAYGVQMQDGVDDETFVGSVAATVEPEQDPARRLTLEQARELLDSGADPWVFFTDDDNGRGHVLYRRYDGHYGLITPRSEDAEALQTA
jgi:ribosome-associated translation inhibitor RaiA